MVGDMAAKSSAQLKNKMGIKGRPTVRKDGPAASTQGIKPLDPATISKTSAEYRSIELWNYKLEKMLVILNADDMTSK